jgi:hypothetical protein
VITKDQAAELTELYASLHATVQRAANALRMAFSRDGTNPNALEEFVREDARVSRLVTQIKKIRGW